MPFVQDSIQANQQFQQIKRPSLGWYFGMFLGKTAKRLLKLAWAVRVSLLWFVLFLVAWSNAAWMGVLVVLLAGAFAAGAHFWDSKLWAAVPFVADSRRLLSLRRQRQELAAGLDFLIRTGVVSESQVEDEFIEAYLSETEDLVVLTVPRPIRGVAPRDLVARSNSFKSLLNAVRISTEKLDGGGVRMTFFINDPLDKDVSREEPAVLDPDKMVVECSVNASGISESIRFGDSSGMVVGGIPGSGKTAGITSFLLPLGLSQYVDLSVIDGKGGEDWTQYARLCSPALVDRLDEKTGEVVDSLMVPGFIRGDEELEPIRDFLRSKHGQMLDRLNNQKQLLGTSNFWNASPEQRLAAGLKFQLIVIDECQGIFEQAGRSKEEKVLLGEIQKYCSALVKRGRSAGFFTVFITQKPTSESLPTAIRDNCGLRIAFHLTTPEAEKAVLGAVPEDSVDMPRALNIPSSRKGGAILAKDTGEFEEVRFIYVPESVQDALIQNASKNFTKLPEVSALGEEVVLEIDDGSFVWESDGDSSVDLVKDGFENE